MALRKYEVEAIVQPGGRIEINALPVQAGEVVHVTIETDGRAEPAGELPSLTSLLGSGSGHFTSVDDVDRFLNDERDNW